MSNRDADQGGRPGLVDLDVLQRRDAPAAARRRPLAPRLLLGLLGLGALYALYSAFLEPLLFPPREVRLGAVRQVKGGAADVRRALASAAGWLEADPFPITVRPLVPGVVVRSEVLEGQRVVGGETVVAVLRNPELENALKTLESALAVKQSQRDLAQSRWDVARALLERKLDLRSALLSAEMAARRDRESVKEAAAAHESATASERRARVELDAQRALQGSGSTPPISFRLAESAYAVTQADVRMRAAALARVQAEAEVNERALLLAQEGLANPEALTGAEKVAAGEMATATAEHAQAQTERDVAAAQVALLTVRAPADGVVLRLLAAPGSPAGPMGELRESTTVGPGSTGALDVASGALALLYDPNKLQARVEVPLSDLRGISEGSEVSLEVDALPGRTFAGTVSRFVGEANIQNNKLWAKVRLTETDPLLRPEMLCRAKFLARPSVAGEVPVGRPRLEVPTGALLGDGVFVYDPTRGGRARHVPVVRHGEAGGYTEVEGDLGTSNQVILDPKGLSDGVRVRGSP